MYKIIIFDYDSWMIFVYKDGEQIEYWSGAEDDWEQSWKTIKYMNPKEEITVKMDSYDEVLKLEEEFDNKNFFNLTEKDIEKLKNIK